MILQRILHSTGLTSKVLTKIGGKIYNSQPKLQTEKEKNNQSRDFRVSSKDKK
jgi:hypothetical protein